MLPTFLANMLWGSNQNDEETAGGDRWKGAEVEHTASEEDGEWLLINTQQTPVGKKKTASYVTTFSGPLAMVF